jgi:putative ABC transport system permease protein
MTQLLYHLVWPEWRAHPWRQALAVLAVALGVALAWSVHLINGSALAEFAGAVRAVQGEPDASLVCTAREGCDDAVIDTLISRADVSIASPVVEIDSYALDAQGQRVPLRLLGIDALQVSAVAPALMPRPAADETRTAVVDPDALFLNPTAMRRLGASEGQALRVQHGATTITLRVAGRVAADGTPLAVLDIAGAQHHFGFAQRLSRIDLRLAAGADAAALPAPPGWRIARADDAEQRVSNVSRAYRVNLTVLALVALFVGAFLVFAVMALSVAQRVPSLALLGVLGLSSTERARLVRAECALLGVAGSALGIALGTLLAFFALRWLAGDLGGGYFPGIAPRLQFSWAGAIVFGLLGVVATMLGGWLPARQAASLAPAQALKGLGGASFARGPAWRGPLLLASGAALAFAPPIAGLPIAAYVSVAVLLLGGVACVPLLIDAVLEPLVRWVHRPIPQGDAGRLGSGPALGPLPLLALSRAHHEREAAAVAVAGVVASLALAVALTVMVASFRDGVARWLDQVLPADLYLRSATQSGAADQAYLDPAFVKAAQSVPGVARIEAARTRPLNFVADQPAVMLISRPLDDPAKALPLLDAPLPPSSLPGVFVSEAMQRLYDAQPGKELTLPIGETQLRVVVLGVWRDYARQFGAVVIDSADYRRATADERINDLSLWLTPGARVEDVQQALRQLGGEQALFDMASATQLRTLSLAIFDRSFVVTRWLQIVAIAIGLAGIAASFSAQALARRREFGLLAHLGFTRRQIVTLVAAEGLTWTAAGALMGLALGLAVAVVLVHVVNPQSFHWTMELLVPWARVGVLLLGVLVAGSVTAALAARAAAGRDVVAAVKEDW